MTTERTERRFRAVDVLTGTIDAVAPARRKRKQISAYLTPEQIRLLSGLHAHFNSAGDARIEKSEIVGLALEILGDLVAEGERAGADTATLAAAWARYRQSIVK